MWIYIIRQILAISFEWQSSFSIFLNVCLFTFKLFVFTGATKKTSVVSNPVELHLPTVPDCQVKIQLGWTCSSQTLQYWATSPTGVKFIDILRVAFARADPKKGSQVVSLFCPFMIWVCKSCSQKVDEIDPRCPFSDVTIYQSCVVEWVKLLYFLHYLVLIDNVANRWPIHDDTFISIMKN